MSGSDRVKVAGSVNAMNKVFLQLLQMTQHMAKNVIPGLLPDIDRMTLSDLTKSISATNSSLDLLSKSIPKLQSSALTIPENRSYQPHSSVGDPIPPSKVSKVPKHDNSQKCQKVAPVNCKISERDYFDGWIRLIKRMDSMVKQNNLWVDMFYCGVCDVQSHGRTPWSVHSTSPEHEKKSSAFKSPGIHHCPTCGVIVFATETDVVRLFNYPQHTALDELVQGRKLKKTAPKPENSSATQPCKTPPATPEKTEHLDYKGCALAQIFYVKTKLIQKNLANHEKFTFFLCVPCVVFRSSQKEWPEHLNSNQHVRNMSDQSVLGQFSCCRCFLCKFEMIVSSADASAYMKFHVSRCHKLSVGKIEEYFEIKVVAKPSPPVGKVPAKPRESMKSCSQAMPSGSKPAPPQPSNHQPSRPGQPSSQTPTSAFPISSMKTIPPFELPPATKFTQKSFVQVELFENANLSNVVSMFNYKKLQFLSNPSIIPFTAFCLLCPQSLFKDQLAWLHHLTVHTCDDEQNEVECCICNTCIYGNVQKIMDELFAHPEHQNMDILMC
ncbi:Hypothetical protein NTJ_14157 [Nesidiocoris tenuis]|uniref:C2H2-type domain-containing protein n=1 Tax=Nesidiocoris tenuis TaxID=355587 RepID=A0ABN7BDT1_9HEMI|nr:Hypothetical protein NTJ_14157 [Nesidiocoris tenuis]